MWAPQIIPNSTILVLKPMVTWGFPMTSENNFWRSTTFHRPLHIPSRLRPSHLGLLAADDDFAAVAVLLNHLLPVVDIINLLPLQALDSPGVKLIGICIRHWNQHTHTHTCIYIYMQPYNYIYIWYMYSIFVCLYVYFHVYVFYVYNIYKLYAHISCDIITIDSMVELNVLPRHPVTHWGAVRAVEARAFRSPLPFGSPIVQDLQVCGQRHPGWMSFRIPKWLFSGSMSISWGRWGRGNYVKYSYNILCN